jgi:hypothetical protein
MPWEFSARCGLLERRDLRRMRVLTQNGPIRMPSLIALTPPRPGGHIRGTSRWGQALQKYRSVTGDGQSHCPARIRQYRAAAGNGQTPVSEPMWMCT